MDRVSCAWPIRTPTMRPANGSSTGSAGVTRTGRAAHLRQRPERTRCWRGSPARLIVDALDAAFYAAFAGVEPIGKRLMASAALAKAVGCRPELIAAIIRDRVP